MSSVKSLEFHEALEALGSDWQDISEAVRQFQAPSSMTCSKGCGTCCHYGLIASSSLEAFGVVVAWLGEERPLEELAQRCRDYTSAYKGAITSIGHLPFSISARKDFLKHRIPCPLFVSADSQRPNVLGGSCGIYAHRPPICSSFNSTADPQLCLSLTGHHADQSLISAGEQASESLRSLERSVFGKSALGHLPLLIAALTTADGLRLFLRVDELASTADEQGIKDFFFYLELLEVLGMELTATDFADLERAQQEASLQRTPVRL